MYKIGPFSDPINLTELVGPGFEQVQNNLFDSYTDFIRVQDSAKDHLNNLATTVQGLESSLASANSLLTPLERQNTEYFLWSGDNFNNTSKVQSSTLYLNTVNSLLELKPESFESYGTLGKDIDISLDIEELKKHKTIPGCNLLALNIAYGAETKATEATFETQNTLTANNLFDQSPSTLFEVERNIIGRWQNLKIIGAGLVVDSAGISRDILEATNGFDWSANISWIQGPNSVLDTGPNGKGVQVAELIGTTAGTQSQELAQHLQTAKAVLPITITLKTPVKLSGFVVHPYVRHLSSTISIKHAYVKYQDIDEKVLVVSDKLISKEDKASNAVYLPIPGSRPVEQLEVYFEGTPSNQVLLAHPFYTLRLNRRSERTYLFFKSVDTETYWQRMEIFKDGPPTLATSYYGVPQGSIGNSDLNALPQRGEVVNKVDKPNPLVNLTQVANSELARATSKANFWGGLMAQAAATLMPQLLNFGGFKREIKVEAVYSGHDIFSGYRASVSIRSLELVNTTYSSRGEYISRPHIFSQPIKSLLLSSEVESPNMPGVTVQFNYSIDNGLTWKAINNSLGTQAPKEVEFETPVRSVLIKIIMTGSNTSKTVTPRVYYYSLRGVPA